MTKPLTTLICTVLILSFITQAYCNHELKAERIRASARNVVGTKFTYPEQAIKQRLAVTYNTCSDAWNDLLYWMVLFYGDWYANKGGNTIMYFIW